MNRTIAAAAISVFLWPSVAAAQQPGDARVVPIQVTGDPAARFSLVILGDGYTAAEMPRFRAHVDKHLNILWSLEPFRSYRNYINVYAVEIVSAESGITCDPAHREPRTTPLGMRFGGGCDNPNARGINVDQESARRYARIATPDYDQILSIANTDTYGGIGGSTATTSGGNALGPYITPHELGHSLGRLQDEYTYSARGVRGGIFEGEEPNSIHHTLLTEEEMRARRQKWWRWLGEPSESGGIIGRYEGGQSRVAGVWRPSRHSMMISLGYYFDQISSERMTQRISGQVELIAGGTPADSPVRPDAVLWIETAHPVYHELNVEWRIDDRVVVPAGDARILDLRNASLSAGDHTVTVAVVDTTAFVRDPEIRDTSFTASRTWRVSAHAPAAPPTGRVRFTGWTDTTRAVGGQDVVYIEATQPADRIPEVRWQLDGRDVPGATGRRSIALAALNLSHGTHRLTATLSDAGAEAPALTWTVDATPPDVEYTLTAPETSVIRLDGSRHHLVRDSLRMHLEPSDDQPGYVVAEFRVNRDGWHHYYGWPDAEPGTPFLFTPRGTTIKELVYGSLSAEGLSPQPWEERAPGWGTHRIEYRARDAAGNIGGTSEFHITFLPEPACTAVIDSRHAGPLNVASGIVCIRDAEVAGPVTVSSGASLYTRNATLRDGLRADGAANVEVVASTIDGALDVRATSGNLVLFGNALNGDGIVADHSGPDAPIVAGNTLRAPFRCEGAGRAPTDLGAPNRANGTVLRTPCPTGRRDAGPGY